MIKASNDHRIWTLTIRPGMIEPAEKHTFYYKIFMGTDIDLQLKSWCGEFLWVLLGSRKILN